MNSETKQCQNCKNQFTIEPDDFNFYKKMKVSPPTWCPECRLIRRMVWRNERVLRRRVCSLCGKKTISVYPEETDFPVYCVSCFKSDNWDPLDYGREYDFSRPFFEQFQELFKVVPRPAIAQNGTNINSEYANIIQDVKNVYLSCSVIWGSENVYYSTNVTSCKDVWDSFNVTESEILYECIESFKNYNCAFVYWSKSCVDSKFLLDCVDCQNCLGCVGLRNKSYCIFNQQYSREDYQEKLKELNLGNFENLQSFNKKFEEFSRKFPRRFSRMIHCINSTGDDLKNSRNAKFSFNSSDLENVKYAFRCPSVKDSMDVTHKGPGELCYEHALGGSDPGINLIAIIYGMPALDSVSYSDYCGFSSNLFGCIGLKNKQYCILNKQYTKEEYEALVSKIISHMNEMPYTDKKGRVYKYGEFFPPEFSPFGYNETYANDYFPKTKEEIEKFGMQWKELPKTDYVVTKKAEELPNDIKDVTNDITKEIISCESTGRPYKILSEELSFYRRMDLPLPRLHPDERQRLRFLKRNLIKLWHRKCTCSGAKSENGVYQNTIQHFHGENQCPNEFETSYAPDRLEIVYCEQCYQAEVV